MRLYTFFIARFTVQLCAKCVANGHFNYDTVSKIYFEKAMVGSPLDVVQNNPLFMFSELKSTQIQQSRFAYVISLPVRIRPKTQHVAL